MADTNSSFYLDTAQMDSVMQTVKELAESLRDSTSEFQQSLTKVTENWKGKGRTTFDKKGHQLLMEMGDVSDALFDIQESLEDAAKAYMEADMELSKQADGKTNRY